MDKARLQRLLVSSFNIEELKDLAYQIDFDFDQSDGKTLATHAINVIDYVEKNDMHGDFFLALKRKRPNQSWWPLIVGSDLLQVQTGNSGDLVDITVQLVRENRNKIMSIDGRVISLERSTDKEKKLQLVIMGDENLGVLSVRDEVKNVRRMAYALLSVQVFIVFMMIFYILWTILPN